MQTITVKPGETYSQQGLATTDGTTPIDITGYTGTATVKDTAGTEVGAFTVAVDVGTAGTFELAASAAETLTWAVGEHRCDIRLAAPGGAIEVSPTFAVRVVTAITEAA